MKKNTCFLTLVLLVLLYETSGAQTLEQRMWLERFAEERAARWAKERAEAETLAIKLGLPIREELPDGKVIELQRFEDGRPVYYETHNINAAKTISTDRVWPGGTGGFSLTGASLDTLGIWDGGRVRTTHDELTGRVVQKDEATTNDNHATHVAGTMIASGVQANAKGMSYQGRLNAYDWNSDQSEMASAAAAGLRTSNHSYGLITGWRWTGSSWQWWGNTSVSSTEDYYFGFYSTEARDWDNIARNAPYYLIVKSAGNDRLQGPTSQPVTHSHSGTGSFTDTHNRDGAPDGYDCISHAGVSKNILTIGAVDDIPNGYTQPSDVVMSTFSSWGPTDDGHIKPDLVANGVDLYSSIATSNSSYDTYSGTLMSSPNVTGSIGLLLQHQRNLHGSTALRSSTMKALLVHTADEAGSNPGPDYVFGWGLMNTLRAAEVMSANAAAGINRHIRELTLTQGQTIDITVASDGTQPLRATICWTDPAGTPPPASLNPTTIMLVNDIDLRTMQGVTTFSPWILNRASPSDPATTGDNIRDNVEQVYLASPQTGNYTVRITHKGTLSGGSQMVSVIITGAIVDQSILAGGTYEVGAGAPTYQKLTQVAADLNSRVVTGNLVFELRSDYDGTTGETFPISFGAFSTSGGDWTVTVRPASGVTAKVTFGDPGTGNTLLNLDGVKRLTFDGRPGGTSTAREWTIRNTRTAATVGPTIQFINDATNNTLTFLKIEGQNITATSGTILFSTSTGTLGNSSNTISNCDIRDLSDAAGVPANAVFSSGTAGAPNASNTIANCNIFNWTSAGVLVAAAGAGNAWVINLNSFYQTAARAAAMNAISIQGGSGHTISGNSIGGSAPDRSGNPFRTTTGVINGINLLVGTVSPTTVNPNTISNISNTGIAFPNFQGILVAGGNVNVTNNVIGGGASIYDTVRTNEDTYCIRNTGAGTVLIQGNTVGNVRNFLTTVHHLRGIRVTAGTATIINNTIRDMYSTCPGSGTWFTSGIDLLTTTSGNTVENNRVFNLHNANTGASIFIIGLFISGVSSTPTTTHISRNNVYNLTGDGTPSLLFGIYKLSGSATYSNNVIALGTTQALNPFIGGIRDDGTTGSNNWFFNSVSISGTSAAGANNTYAFNRNSTATVTIKDNIFANFRTGGTGFHVAIANTNAAATGWAATASDYNLLHNIAGSHLAQWLGSLAANNRESALRRSNFNFCVSNPIQIRQLFLQKYLFRVGSTVI